jgi:hypothetical protein
VHTSRGESFPRPHLRWVPQSCGQELDHGSVSPDPSFRGGSLLSRSPPMVFRLSWLKMNLGLVQPTSSFREGSSLPLRLLGPRRLSGQALSPKLSCFWR